MKYLPLLLALTFCSDRTSPLQYPFNPGDPARRRGTPGHDLKIDTLLVVTEDNVSQYPVTGSCFYNGGLVEIANDQSDVGYRVECLAGRFEVAINLLNSYRSRSVTVRVLQAVNGRTYRDSLDTWRNF